MNKVWLTCDNCGKEFDIETADSCYLLAKAEAKGWVGGQENASIFAVNHEFCCEECREEYKKMQQD